MTNKTELYYIQSEERGFTASGQPFWWRPNRKGYTTDISKAGKYTHEEAKEICQSGQEVMYECFVVDTYTVPMVMFGNIKLMGRRK